MPPLERALISVAAAARLAGVTPSTAYRWLERGELAGAVRVGNRWYVRRRVLLAWLDGQDTTPVAETPATRLRAVS